MNILIIEPNTKLHNPYALLSQSHNIERVTSPELGLKYMSQQLPELVLLSTSPSITKILSFLESLKNASHQKLIPLMFVIDLSYKLSTIPGTTWGNKLGVITSISSENELNSTIRRITSE
jgi:DNA-binding response OmpR family regulator